MGTAIGRCSLSPVFILYLTFPRILIARQLRKKKKKSLKTKQPENPAKTPPYWIAFLRIFRINNLIVINIINYSIIYLPFCTSHYNFPPLFIITLFFIYRKTQAEISSHLVNIYISYESRAKQSEYGRNSQKKEDILRLGSSNSFSYLYHDFRFDFFACLFVTCYLFISLYKRKMYCF